MRSELGSITHITTSRADSGQVRQMVSTLFSSAASVTATRSWDDTIPQASEGKLIMSATITPAATANTLLIMANMVSAHSAATGRAIFFLCAGPTGGATGDSKAAVIFGQAGIAEATTIPLIWTGNPTAATTHVYSIRAAAHFSGTLTMNGASLDRYFGGVCNSSLVIQEVVA